MGTHPVAPDSSSRAARLPARALAGLLGLAVVLASSTTGTASPGGLRMGQDAPHITVETWLQGPPDPPSWETLRGKVVVIDFWATWCPPCVASIPHLNRLVDRFASRGVVFLSVTEEKPEVVRRFLEEHPISSWVGLDLDGSMTLEYGAPALPHTVVVDRKGRVNRLTHPADLTPAMLESLADPPPAAAPPEVRASIGPHRAGGDSEVRLGDERFEALGTTLLSAVAIAWDVDERRIAGGERLPAGLFDVVVTGPATHADLRRKALAFAIEERFGLRVEDAATTLDGWALSTLPGWAPSSSEATQGRLRQAPGHISARAVSIGLLCRALEDVLDQPVVDETAFRRTFDLELRWDAARPESVRPALRQAGLGLTRVTRSARTLTVRQP